MSILSVLSVLSVFLCLIPGNVTTGSQHARPTKQIECERLAMGAMYRMEGHAGRVLWWGREQMVGEEPKDAIHIRDDGETDVQKAVWEKPLLRGWTLQDNWMADHDDVARDPKLIFTTCLLSEDS